MNVIYKSLMTIVFSIAALLMSNAAIACQCGPGVSFEQAVADAQVVVLATMKSKQTLADGKGVEGTFAIKETLKGMVGTEFKMTTPSGKKNCGISFNDKQTYLFILDGQNWTIGSCDHGGPIPTDLEHAIMHEVENILADPQKAVAQAKAFQAQEIWIKKQGPELYIQHARLNKCAEKFDIDKAAKERQSEIFTKAKKHWHEMMKSRLDNPRVLQMLGNVLNQQATKTMTKEEQQGKFDKIMCEALVLDGAVEETFKRLQSYQ